FLCIEIVSSDDRMSRLMVRVKEYLAFGVTYVWVIDPQSRTGYVYTKDEGREVRDSLTTTNPDISISLSELFAELDEDSKTD
ncbi:MAG: Uma2 family endonuclease, partial [Acidobacteriaceae bacterium]|nr:Uma2 family endonuclease [Acidobacteriaceae bacterium]